MDAAATAADTLADWLTRTTWQSAVVVAMVVAVHLLAGRRLAPRWRFALWGVVVVRLLMPVVPQSVLSVFNLPVPDARATVQMSGVYPTAGTAGSGTPREGEAATLVGVIYADGVTNPGSDGSVASRAELALTDAHPGATELASGRQLDWRIALVVVWLAGAAVCVGRVLLGAALMGRKLRGASHPGPDFLAILDNGRQVMGVTAAVPILVTDAVRGPALFGFRRPRLLLPPGLVRELSPGELRFVFLHELAHVRRRDALTNAALLLAGALHWFNPLARLAVARCRAERELACDELVMEATAPAARAGYGRAVLRVAETLVTARRPSLLAGAAPPAIGLIPSGSQLRRRIAMISTFPDVPRRHRRPVLPLLLVLGVCSCALTNRQQPASADDPAAPAKPAVAAAIGDGVAGAPAALTDASAAQPGTATVPPAPAPRAEVGPDDDGVRDPEAVRATPPKGNAAAGAADPFAGAGAAAEPPVSPAIEALLQRTLPELTFDGAGLADVLEFVRDVTAANVVVDWAAIEAAGVKRDAPVTLRVKNVSVGQGLRLVLDQADGAAADAKLDFAPDGDVLRISTRAALGRRLETRVYDVRDLLVVIHDFVPAPDVLAVAELPDAPPPPTTTAPATQSPESLLADIVKLVRETVDAGQWDGGPQSNTIRGHQGQLVVSAPPASHRQIAALMSQLRETRAVQVIVEARFITLDVAKLDGGLPEKLRQTFDRPGEPGVVSLSSDEMRAVMAGLNADAGTTVNAPRVMLFNGQRAYVLVGTQRAYISGWNVVVADDGGEKRYEATNSTVTAGLVFDVQATASLDRRDVTLMLRPKLTKLLDIDSAPFVGTADAPKDLLIQVPRLDVTSAETLATVPDGATLLLGGFRQTLNTPDGPTTRPVTDLFVLVKPTIVVRGKAQPAEPEANPPANPEGDPPAADEPAELKIDVK